MATQTATNRQSFKGKSPGKRYSYVLSPQATNAQQPQSLTNSPMTATNLSFNNNDSDNQTDTSNTSAAAIPPLIAIQATDDVQLFQDLFIENTKKYISTLNKSAALPIDRQAIAIIAQYAKLLGSNIVKTLDAHTVIDKNLAIQTIKAEQQDKENVQQQNAQAAAKTSTLLTTRLPAEQEWQRLLATKDEIFAQIDSLSQDLPTHIQQVQTLKHYLDEQQKKSDSLERVLVQQQQQQNGTTNGTVTDNTNQPVIRHSSKLAARLAAKQR